MASRAEFNLLKLENLPDVKGTADKDLVLVSVDQGDGTFKSFQISSRDFLSTANTPLEDAVVIVNQAYAQGYNVDLSQIRTQEDANKIFVELFNRLMAPAIQEINGNQGKRGLVFPDDTFEYDKDSGKLTVIIPDIDIAVPETPGASGVAGIMFPDQSLDYDEVTGKLGVTIPTTELAEGGATGATGIPGIMFPNETLTYDNSTGELGVNIEEIPLAEGGATGATGIPGLMFPNDTLEYNNGTGELGVVIPEIELAEGGATGATGLPGIMFPNDTLDYNNATGELGVTIPEVPLAEGGATGATGLPGIMFPNDTLEYNNATGELGVDIPLASQSGSTPGILYPNSQFSYDETTGELGINKATQAINGATGVIGVMFPDDTLRYDPSTGELGVDIPSGTQFVGIIGTDTTLGQVESSNSTDEAGYYYIVAEQLVLNGTWDPVSGTQVEVGDVVIKDDSDEWSIIPKVLSFGVISILSNTAALKVDGTNSQYPVLSIDNSTPGATGLDGLMSGADKEKLDNLDQTLLDYVKSVTSTTKSLEVDNTDTQNPILSVLNATPGATGLDGLMSGADKEKLDNLDDIYVNKSGDTMIGTLTMDGTSITMLNSSEIFFKDTGRINAFQNNKIQFQVDSADRMVLGQQSLDYVGGKPTNFKNVAGDDVILSVTPASNHAVYKGLIDTDICIVNKKYSDDQDGILKNDIVSIQEEIDVLRNTITKGEYDFEDPRVLLGDPNTGTFYLLKDLTGVATSYGEATIIGINKEDLSGNTHSFTEVHVDDMISFFDKEDDGFGAYQITSIIDDQPGFAIYGVDVVSSKGNPNDTTRCFFYENVTGSINDDQFIKKVGDTVQGLLVFDTANKGIGFEKNGLIGFDSSVTLRLGTGLNSINMQPSIEFTSTKTEFKNRPVFYDGDITEDNHIVNKEYVDTESVTDAEFNAYKIVSPDLFDVNDNGTMTYVSDAYLAGAPFDVSPGIHAVRFANKDINGRRSIDMSVGGTFDLLAKDTSNGPGFAQFMIGSGAPGPYGHRIKRISSATHVFKGGTYVYVRTPSTSTKVIDIHYLNSKPTSEIFQVKVGIESDARPTSSNTMNYIYANDPDAGNVDMTILSLTDDDFDELTGNSGQINIRSRAFLYIRGYIVALDYADDINKTLRIMGDFTSILSPNEGNLINMTFDADDRVVRNHELISAFDFSSYPELT